MSWQDTVSNCDWKALTEKLKLADESIGKIFQTDGGQVIPADKIKLLSDYQQANKKIFDKLESREFTVAIVGLENSGKSTLGNALINANVLPEFRERCTYTTTEIRAGSNDVAEVRFYSREDFSAIFRGMLQTVEYPDYAAANFETFSAADFKNYWHEVAQDSGREKFYGEHNTKTAADIKTILDGKNEILKLLGKPPELFSGDKWTSEEFKRYITGILDENATPIQRVPAPYAVEKVIIRSTQLADMSNIVIYDVPGFNSPTEIHQSQTEDMLKSADAIIFVTNIVNPNLDILQLKVLNKNKQDEDNIELRDKVFVFGNKIDATNNLNDSLRNLETLRKEAVETYKIAVAERVMAGSARAFFESEGKIPPEKRVVNPDFYNWQLEDRDGIKTLREKLQYYYDTDRFEIIKKRAKNNLGKIAALLKELIDFFAQEKAKNPNVPEFTAKFALETKDRLKKFLEEAHEISHSCNHKINSETSFTNALKNDIEIIYPPLDAESELVRHEEQKLRVDLDGVYPVTTVDRNIRHALSEIFIKNIVVSASKLTTERQKNLRGQLVDSFLENLGMETPNPAEDDLKKSVNDLFDFLLTHGDLAQVDFKCNFNALVERFTATITQTLILEPFAAHERYQKIDSSLTDLIIFAIYYNKFSRADYKKTISFENIGENGMQFFLKILEHSGIKRAAAPNDNLAAANKAVLAEFIADKSTFPIGKWAERLAKIGINLTDKNNPDAVKFVERLSKIFKFYEQKKFDYKICIKNVEDEINALGSGNVNAKVPSEPMSKKSSEGGGTMMEQIEKINKDVYAANQLKDKAQMIKILNEDIEVLRDVMKVAVIDAIGLERAFISVVTKNVELIREHLQEGEGQAQFNAWIIENAKRLMPSKFNLKQQENYDARVKIMTQIESLLSVNGDEVMFAGI